MRWPALIHKFLKVDLQFVWLRGFISLICKQQISKEVVCLNITIKQRGGKWPIKEAVATKEPSLPVTK